MGREKQSLGRRLGNPVVVLLALLFVLVLVLPLALVAAILYFLHRLAVFLLVWAITTARSRTSGGATANQPHGYRRAKATA
jgi:hypothetical protein